MYALYSVRQNSINNRLKLFDIFLTTDRNLDVKFHAFIIYLGTQICQATVDYLQLRSHGFFGWPASDFLHINTFCAAKTIA